MLEPPDTFRNLFPNTPNDELATVYGVSRPTIQRWAKRLGLQKDSTYKSEIQSSRTSNRVFDQSYKKKLSDKAKGRKMSPETINKIVATKRATGALNKGEKHWNWKGGKPWERFKDPRYQDWRNSVLSRDKYTCQHCQRICKKYEKGLAAHHIKPYASYPELRFELSNGLTLCRECHMLEHGKITKISTVPCACGCGTIINSKDRYGRARRFVNGHGRRKRSSDNEPEV